MKKLYILCLIIFLIGCQAPVNYSTNVNQNIEHRLEIVSNTIDGHGFNRAQIIRDNNTGSEFMWITNYDKSYLVLLDSKEHKDGKE